MNSVRYGIWIAITELVGLISGILSRAGTQRYQMSAVKPPLSPPAIVFPLAWTILYGLMGVSAARIYAAPDSRQRSRGLNLFVFQLVLNFFWSLIFFNLQAYGFALVWLIVLWTVILLMILAFRQVDRTAALVQLPYLLWVTFAAYLNYGVWQLN